VHCYRYLITTNFAGRRSRWGSPPVSCHRASTGVRVTDMSDDMSMYTLILKSLWYWLLSDCYTNNRKWLEREGRTFQQRHERANPHKDCAHRILSEFLRLYPCSLILRPSLLRFSLAVARTQWIEKAVRALAMNPRKNPDKVPPLSKFIEEGTESYSIWVGAHVDRLPPRSER
jgi:hypothetical protein